MLSNHHLKNCTAFRFVLMAFLCSKNICCGQLHSSPFCFYGALILEEFVAENCTAFRFVFIAFCCVNALTTAAENCTAFRFASMALYCCKNCRGNCTAFRSVLIYLYIYIFCLMRERQYAIVLETTHADGPTPHTTAQAN